jgi:hypothetical protein
MTVPPSQPVGAPARDLVARLRNTDLIDDFARLEAADRIEELTKALDTAWEEINALGGRSDQDNSYDQGIVDTVAKALEIIERAKALSLEDRK